MPDDPLFLLTSLKPRLNTDGRHNSSKSLMLSTLNSSPCPNFLSFGHRRIFLRVPHLFSLFTSGMGGTLPNGWFRLI